MHPRIYQEFEQLCSGMKIDGSVLEVGAMPSKKTLLCMDAMAGAKEKVGINMDGPHEFMGFKILKGNANRMDMFEDGRFDLVLCNALFEHDKFFWKTLAEIKRITRPGGTIILGTPGYTWYGPEKIKKRLRRLPLLRTLNRHQSLNALFCSTITFEIHDAPGDYYRFSPQAFREVFFDDLDNVDIRTIMLPPRIIGVGTKRMN